MALPPLASPPRVDQEGAAILTRVFRLGNEAIDSEQQSSLTSYKGGLGTGGRDTAQLQALESYFKGFIQELLPPLAHASPL